MDKTMKTMNAHRILAALAAFAISVGAFAQAQITTKKEKVGDFTLKTMKVVLSGNAFADQAIREAMNNTWSLSPFEFCSFDEFNSLKTSDEYYFMIPVKARYRNETAPGIMMLCIVKGKPGAKSVNDMVDIVSMPACPADIPSGRENAMLAGLVDIMQGYIQKSMQNGFKGLGAYTRPLYSASRRRTVVCEDDVCEALTDKNLAKFRKKGIEITDDATADSLFLDGGARTLVSYVVAPSDPGKGSFCWKFMIDAKTHELYYFRKHKISRPEMSGFLKSDLAKLCR